MNVILAHADQLPEVVRNELTQLVASLRPVLSRTQTTVGAAGAAAALPATPSAYVEIRIGNVDYVMPLYLKS